MLSDSDEIDYLDFSNDGRTDRLTGLDAPEIFYRMLAKELASLMRRRDRRLSLIVITLKSSHAIPVVSAQLVALANLLRSATRADEFVTRLGERSFVMVVGYASNQVAGTDGKVLEGDEILTAILTRLRLLVDDFLKQDENLWRDSRNFAQSDTGSAAVDISGIQSKEKEGLLDLLERAGV